MIEYVKKLYARKVINAAFWTTSAHILSQVIRLASNLIMTRLLVPEAFGLMALAQVIIMGVNLISDVGLRQKIIQSEREDSIFLNTIWTIQFVRGFWIFLLIVVIAFLLEFLQSTAFFDPNATVNHGELPTILLALSTIALIGSATSTNIVLAQKRLLALKIAKVEISIQVLSILSMITIAYFWRSVWAMVIANILTSVLTVISSHLFFSGIKNRFQWSKEIFHEVIHFGKWILLSTLVGYFSMHGPTLIFGNYINAADLGFISIAFLLIGAYRQVIEKLVSAVIFPAISDKYKSQKDIKPSYYKYREFVDFLVLGGAGFLFFTANSIVNFLYDPRYELSGDYLQILCLFLMMERYKVAGNLFIAAGKPKIIFINNIIYAFSLFTLLPFSLIYFDIKVALLMIGISRHLPLIYLFKKKIENGYFNVLSEILLLKWLLLGGLIGFGFNNLIF